MATSAQEKKTIIAEHGGSEKNTGLKLKSLCLQSTSAILPLT
jgi:hypothetical protein